MSVTRYTQHTRDVRPFAITELRLRILRRVELQPGISAMEVCSAEDIPSDTVRPTLTKLVESGHLSRKWDPVFHLTNDGQKVLDDVREMLGCTK